MKVKTVYIVFLITSLFSFNSLAQDNTVKGYKIEGDEIVFTFNKKDYEVATSEKNQMRFDFSDFDIDKVVVSGQFNNWSREGWKMKKVSEDIFELRKKLSDFDEEFKWEFKFYINDEYWAEPTQDFPNVVPAKSENGKPYYTYNLKIVNAYPSKKGNKKFFLRGFYDAEKVIVTGSFNKWDEDDFEMKKTDKGWELTLQLRPNTYQYKFIVDGQWYHDPDNPNKIVNEYHGYNSVFTIKKDVTFTLNEYKNAKNVILSGSFNNWSEEKYIMKKVNNNWVCTLSLEKGKYHYKYIVDGKWILDPFNSVKEYDEHGNINSVRMIR